MNVRIAIAIISLFVMQSGCSTLTTKTQSPVERTTTFNTQRGGGPQDNDVAPHNMTERRSAPIADHIDHGETASRMAVIWKEKIFQQPGARPVRGFTGRLYFYNNRDQLVTVDGELVVFGYNDSKTIRSEVADRKYVFPADKFANHYSESELGHSYSIWIPWEDYGGVRKSISLVPIFKDRGDHLIQGASDRLTLSGRAPENATVEKTNIATGTPDSVNPRQSNLVSNRRNQSETIKVPRSLARQFSQAPASRFSQRAQQNLQTLESQQYNANGELYNRTQLQQTQLRAQEIGRPRVAPVQATTNFSDSASPMQNPAGFSPQGGAAFGRPGAFR